MVDKFEYMIVSASVERFSLFHHEECLTASQSLYWFSWPDRAIAEGSSIDSRFYYHGKVVAAWQHNSPWCFFTICHGKTSIHEGSLSPDSCEAFEICGLCEWLTSRERTKLQSLDLWLYVKDVTMQPQSVHDILPHWMEAAQTDARSQSPTKCEHGVLLYGSYDQEMTVCFL
jgi:hypothetical protein